MYQAESDLWKTLLGELVEKHGEGTNPFRSLMQVYTFGLWPMGWRDELYDVYVYRREATGTPG
jgi:hypothetical protein